MAIALWGSVSLIIPITIIDIYYPGGYEKYKLDNIDIFTSEYYGKFYDDYLVTECSMGGVNMTEEWEKYGVNIIKNENGIEKWDEVCIIDFFYHVMVGKEVPCDWIEISDRIKVEMKIEWRNKNKWIRKNGI